MDCIRKDTVKALQKVNHTANFVPKHGEIEERNISKPKNGEHFKKDPKLGRLISLPPILVAAKPGWFMYLSPDLMA